MRMEADRLKTQKWSRRTVYVAAAIAMIASTSGFALASAITVQPGTQHASFYSFQGAAATNFAAPTVNVSYSPGPCARTLTDGTTGATASIVLSASGNTGTCTAGNFAEKFVFSFSGTIATQAANLTVYTATGSNGTAMDFGTVTLGTGTLGAFTATVVVYVDYGQVGIPLGGIPVLEIVVH